MDLSNTNNWKFIYDYNYKIFYETVPDANRFKINGGTHFHLVIRPAFHHECAWKPLACISLCPAMMRGGFWI